MRAGHQNELSDYLTTLGRNIDTAADMALPQVETAHFMRWVVVRDSVGDAWLAFESNYDTDIAAS